MYFYHYAAPIKPFYQNVYCGHLDIGYCNTFVTSFHCAVSLVINARELCLMEYI